MADEEVLQEVRGTWERGGEGGAYCEQRDYARCTEPK